MSDGKTGQQIVGVDARKLALGLMTAFEGVAMVFDSIGLEPDEDAASGGEKSGQTDNGSSPKIPSADTTPAPRTAQPVNINQNERDDPAGAGHTTDPDAEADEDGKQAEQESTEAASPASPITADDVTKIIVQKIKKDRSNNEKIGQIVETYGVKKVSELPAEKYEAFLTDLAAL